MVDASREDKRLLLLERVGQVCTTCFAVISFESIVYQWNIFLIISIVAMLLYEGFWRRYFLSEKTLSDFYSLFLGIPLAGATLPIIAFLCLGISFQNIYLIISVIVLGIGHIGIHYQHVCE